MRKNNTFSYAISIFLYMAFRFLMKNIIFFALCLILSGCFKFEPVKEAIISPSNDQLVNLIYAKLLTENGIVFSISEDGYYVSEKINLDKMEALTEEAHEQASNATKTRLISSCVVERVKGMLDDEIYEVSQVGEEMFINAPTSIFHEAKITDKVFLAEQECEKNI